MKVLLLSPLPPPSGGIASWTMRYKEYCQRNGIDLRIINIAMIGKRASKEVMKKSLLDELKRTIRIITNLIRELRKFNPDIVHINTSCQRMGVIRDGICLSIAVRKKPVIIHCRCNIEDQLSGELSKRVFRYMVIHSDRVITLNRFSKAYVENICEGKAITIANFANEKMIDEHHNIKPIVEEALIVGHVEKAKGLHLIIKAAQDFPQVHFLFVGAVREDISSLSLPENVEIVGRVEFTEVQKYLKEADILIQASKSEGFSNAVLEAMAMGLPIIATDVGANYEMLEGCGGYIMKEQTSDEISNGIKYLEPIDKRIIASKWNVNKVKNEYYIDYVMSKYLSLYNHIITTKKRN